jgi:hypothetical protein
MNINKKTQLYDMKWFHLFVTVLLLLGTVHSQADLSYVACEDNTTAKYIYNLTACSSGVCEEVSAIVRDRCPYGCNNETGGSNECNPDPTDSFAWQGATVAIMTFLIGLCVVLAYWGKDRFEMWLLFMGAAFMSLLIDLALIRSILIGSSASSLVITIIDDAIILFATIFLIFFGYIIMNYIKSLFEKKRNDKYSGAY